MTVENIRVLHLDSGLEWRGGQMQVMSLMRGLRDRGIEQCLICRKGGELAVRVRDEGFEVEESASWGEMNPFAARSTIARIKKGNFNILHAHAAHAHALGLRAVGKCPDVKLVVTRRVDFEVGKTGFSRRKYADPRIHYIAISNGIRDVLIRGGVGSQNIDVVPSGIDPARFTGEYDRSNLRREFGFEIDTPVSATSPL